MNGEHLKACVCSDKFNLPIMITNYDKYDEWFVLCDFCGNKSKRVHKNEEYAAFYWNEFQYKRGKL